MRAPRGDGEHGDRLHIALTGAPHGLDDHRGEVGDEEDDEHGDDAATVGCAQSAATTQGDDRDDHARQGGERDDRRGDRVEEEVGAQRVSRVLGVADRIEGLRARQGGDRVSDRGKPREADCDG